MGKEIIKTSGSAYDVRINYNSILKNFQSEIINNEWLVMNGEESFSKTLLELVKKTLDNMVYFNRENLIIQRVILHELSNADNEKDIVVLRYLYNGISYIRKTYYNMNDYYRAIYFPLKKYNIKKDSQLTKAIINDCDIVNKRIKEKRKMIKDEYIYLSAIRPYYFDLQKRGISFKSDIQNYVNLNGKWDEEKDSFNDYIQNIIDFTAKSGKTNHIDARLECYDKINKYIENAKEEKHRKEMR